MRKDRDHVEYWTQPVTITVTRAQLSDIKLAIRNMAGDLIMGGKSADRWMKLHEMLDGSKEDEK